MAAFTQQQNTIVSPISWLLEFFIWLRPLTVQFTGVHSALQLQGTQLKQQ